MTVKTRALRTVALCFGFLAVVSSAPVLQHTPHARAIQESRRVVEALVQNGQTPGVAVAVALDGAIVWSEGFGFANLEHRVRVSDETRFGIGSISKTLAMAAAVRLMQRGELDLDAPVERYLADFPHKNRGITVRRLAAHQSGMSDAFAAAHYATSRHFEVLMPPIRRSSPGRSSTSRVPDLPPGPTYYSHRRTACLC